MTLPCPIGKKKKLQNNFFLLDWLCCLMFCRFSRATFSFLFFVVSRFIVCRERTRHGRVLPRLNASLRLILHVVVVDSVRINVCLPEREQCEYAC